MYAVCENMTQAWEVCRDAEIGYAHAPNASCLCFHIIVRNSSRIVLSSVRALITTSDTPSWPYLQVAPFYLLCSQLVSACTTFVQLLPASLQCVSHNHAVRIVQVRENACELELSTSYCSTSFISQFAIIFPCFFSFCAPFHLWCSLCLPPQFVYARSRSRTHSVDFFFVRGIAYSS